ncbi:MAG: FtsW/RodA/SpoVE family cell cycle protein, partial [bacterium]|nr:FtsW/RodA/SpoVE family cell cycle protein [bacterium]
MHLPSRPTRRWWATDEGDGRPDLGLMAVVLLLSGFGLLMIFSATRTALERQELLPSASTERQLVFMLIGVVGMVALSYVDYRHYQFLAPLLYVGCMVALGAAFLFDPVKGVQRWITIGPVNIQPAEFTKLALVMSLASLLSRGPEESYQQLPWRKVGYALALLAPPVGLIFFQPDLGTMMSLPFILMLMLFV